MVGEHAADPAQLVHGAGNVAALGGVGRGLEREPDPVHPAQLLRLVHPVPQRQCLIVVPVRLSRRRELLSLLSGPDGGGERPGDVMARQAVMGQLGRRSRHGVQPFLVGQQARQRRVQPGPLAGQQVGVDRLAQQRVPERVALLAVGGEQLVSDRLADRRLVLGGRQPGRFHDQLVVHPAAAHRGGAQRLLRRHRQLLHPGHEQRGQAGRQFLVTTGRGEQLLGVVGVALGPVHDGDQLRRVEHPPPAGGLGERGDVRRERRRVERPEVNRGDVRQPEQLRDHRAERVTAVQVVGPVAAEHRHLLAVQHPGQERDQVARRPVSPVQVLEHEQHRARLGQLGEQAEHRAEQLLPGQFAAVAVGEDARSLIGQQRGRGPAGPRPARPPWPTRPRRRCAVRRRAAGTARCHPARRSARPAR